MKKFFENLFILPCKFPNWLSRDKTSSTLTTEYTFNKYIPDRSIMLSRMKVRQEPPARKGYYGKQGGQRFRTILKYPIATDKAMKRFRDMILLYGAGGVPGGGEIPMSSVSN